MPAWNPAIGALKNFGTIIFCTNTDAAILMRIDHEAFENL